MKNAYLIMMTTKLACDSEIMFDLTVIQTGETKISVARYLSIKS